MLNDVPPSDVDDHDDQGGLGRDVSALVGRRDMLRLIGGMSIAGLLAACRVDLSGESTTTSVAGSITAAADTTPPSTQPSATSPGVTNAAPGDEIPDEAAGPFPADGTNGPNMLDEDDILRSDITTSIGGSTGRAEGIPLKYELSIVDAATGSPMPGMALYLWTCDAPGRYSIYEIPDQNYLRGLQVADEAGRITFDAIFPGCYPGRWPHAHFEIYASLEGATSGERPIKTSQLALPRADCEVAYDDDRYGDSRGCLDRLSLDSDIVFRDGWSDQLATVAGSVTDGYTASLLVRV